MNKKELVNYVAANTELTKKDANTLLNSVIEGIKHGLTSDGKVGLVGFGTFSLVKRNARTARNPQTGEPIAVPKKVVPTFKASNTLKNTVEHMELDD